MNDQEFHKREVLARIQNRVWSHSVTIRISKIVGDSEESWSTASGVFARIDDRLVVITAWHVIEKYVEIRTSGAEAVVVVGNVPLFRPRYLFLDMTNDIVVLDVTAEAGTAIGALPYLAARGWPPPRVEVGNFVLICGFPAIFRTDGESIEHGDFSYSGEVCSVSEYQFLVELEEEVENAGRHPLPSRDADLGGLSGCAVFMIHGYQMELVAIFCQTAVSAPVWMLRSLAHLPPRFDGPSLELV